MSRDFDWSAFLFILGAVRWTVLLSLIAFAGGAVGGLLLAVMRTSRHAVSSQARRHGSDPVGAIQIISRRA